MAYFVIPALGEGLWVGILLAFSAAALLSLLRFNASSRHSLLLLMLMTICAIPLIVSRPIGFTSEKNQDLKVQQVHFVEKSQSAIEIPLPIAAGVLGVIVLISVFRLALLFLAFRTLKRLRKESTPAPPSLNHLLSRVILHAQIKRKIQIRLSSRLHAPALAGFFHPIVLFPENLLSHLRYDEIEQILFHEIAHLKRHDDWAILIQRFLSAIFFFNPAVVWISKQMDLEREIACDDSVIEAGGTPRSYALCLTRLAEYSRPLAGSPLLSASSQLNRRVEMLLNRSNKSSKTSTLSVIGIVVFISGLLFWVLNSNPLLAIGEDKQKSKIVVQNIGAVDEELLPMKTESYQSASKRMQEAQKKMEEAREEMLQAAEAMRQAKQNHDAVMGHETRKTERIMRDVEREIKREQHRKHIRITRPTSELPALQPLQPPQPLVPPRSLVPLQPLAPPRPLTPQQLLIPPQPLAPQQLLVPSQLPAVPAAETPGVPENLELAIDIEPELDFEVNPMPEPDPDLPQI
jgi:beta-lactamase regulating signal transducer with metallopeptidase domain